MKARIFSAALLTLGFLAPLASQATVANGSILYYEECLQNVQSICKGDVCSVQASIENYEDPMSDHTDTLVQGVNAEQAAKLVQLVKDNNYHCSNFKD